MDYIFSESKGFNTAFPTVMHIDLNSCFASVERQANPLLRGKPVAVAAYTTPRGCILAASSEAKYQFGVKTGMRVEEGLALCPNLVVLPSDPNKYRFVNRALVALIQEYSSDLEVKSIDELVVKFANSPALNRRIDRGMSIPEAMMDIGREIKERIKSEIGRWLTVSVGISTNRFLAKTASGIHKPDGLDVITAKNIESVLQAMALEDLCGIKEGNGGRLRRYGISTALGFYRSSIRTLRSAFQSIVGYYWWLRLHGWEADDRTFARKSYGHSYALYTPYSTKNTKLHQILCQLTEKMGSRLRRNNYTAQGIHVGCSFASEKPLENNGQGGWHHGGSYWHKGVKLTTPIYSNRDLYATAMAVLKDAPNKPVRTFAVSCHYLSQHLYEQLTLEDHETQSRDLARAIDALNNKWGAGVVFSGRILGSPQKIKDRISFGGVKELEEFVFKDEFLREQENGEMPFFAS